MEQVRCSCGLLVPWRTQDGWLGRRFLSARAGVQWDLACAPCQDCSSSWSYCLTSARQFEGALCKFMWFKWRKLNFSLKILKKIWLVLQWVFYVGYILYKVSLIQYFCISLLFSENVLQYSACAFLKGFGRWKREATTLLSSYTKYTVGRKKQINTIFIYSGILDKGFLCFSANISSSWPLWSILAPKFLKADTETLLCNCSARVWTCCDSGYTAMKKGTHPRGESYFAFNRDGKRD